MSFQQRYFCSGKARLATTVFCSGQGLTKNNMFKNNKGFSLIELSIVLVIMGILISFGTGMIAPLTKRVKYTETKEVVNAAVESIISFASANNRIPTTSEFQSIVRTPRDAWTKDLYYIPDVNLDDLNAGGICGRKTTGITVRVCTNAQCTSYNDISNVAFVIVSGSENYNIQTNNVSGRVTVYETGTINIDNYTTDMNRPETYDDLIKWITLNELRTKAGCTGAQLSILNNELPPGMQNNAYGPVTIFATGGVGSSTYRWSRQQSASTGLTFNPNTLYPTYGTATTLTISGTPTAFGSFSITSWVTDGDGNTANKPLNLSITKYCPSITVRNSTGGNRSYRIGNTGATCVVWNKNTNTTPVPDGATFYVYSGTTCSGTACPRIVTYDTLKSADANGNCLVRMSGTTCGAFTFSDL
jgi:prepilin-type N-terminal cleavage/methylation domain-containing protein